MSKRKAEEKVAEAPASPSKRGRNEGKVPKSPKDSPVVPAKSPAAPSATKKGARHGISGSKVGENLYKEDLSSHENRHSEAVTMDNLGAKPTGILTLDDGTTYVGHSFGAKVPMAGEVVFNTGMVGYPESLTDPSYAGQILVLTYPAVGNYGVPDDEKDSMGLPKYFESDKVQISGLIVCDYSHDPSHWSSRRSLSQWLTAAGVPALYAVDTRMLTKHLRTRGAMLGKITFQGGEDVELYDPNKLNLVAQVCRKKSVTYGSGPVKIVAIDCGMKNNIIRYMVNKGVELKVVPWDADLSKENYDGLFISNGPGDPIMCDKTIENVRKILNSDKGPFKPIFGICLGNQILALAAGAKTYKMKFGNRGMNQPVLDMRTTMCYITPQNHGFAVDTATLPKEWKPMFMNANDYSNEGIIHTTKPFFSVQFHPEAMGGPTDTEFLFDMFLRRVKEKNVQLDVVTWVPPVPTPNKVLLLGSGGLSIGQAGEFDYSGSQCIKALKEEGLHVVLINPNIATVQTSKGMADKVYFLPVTPEFVEEVIKIEAPDGILLQFGGQTALNCGIQLRDQGILDKYNVKVLGTPVDAIVATEDREVFAQKLNEIGEHVAPCQTATTVEEGLEAAKDIGFPVLIRAGFALGGLGSGFAANEKEALVLLKKGFAVSSQVIVDKSLRGWKEVEYEVVRDTKGNCITVCNMENFDPLGIHTGDSIVVAPSQTLSNAEYYKLRSTAIKVIKHLGVIGECNIQYALDPNSEQYCIIEVNARLSRSSALASKATGYPLAYVAAKLSLGHALPDIKNQITKTTVACFEPALDYMVVKYPRWDMRKFNHVSSEIGSAMKSVGEVMSIGRNFEEAFQKAVRMVAADGSVSGFGASVASLLPPDLTKEQLERGLRQPSDIRVQMLALALMRGYTVEKLYELTFIDKWFLCKLRRIVEIEMCITASKQALTSLSYETLLQAKRAGFSDRQLAKMTGSTELAVRKQRHAVGVRPYVKQIDTLAAEYPAQTNYLYMTYHGEQHDVTFDEKGVMVLGCGAYRIGSSCEFDWCAVSCIRSLRKLGRKSIMVNYNPETVSTDYDECDRLYFEELSLERVLDIYEVEHSGGVVVSVGGQVPNNIAVPLANAGVNILGTSASDIDKAEDRSKFSSLLDSINVDQPAWKQLTTLDEAKMFATRVGYPVLVRPSYVLSGAAMIVVGDENELKNFLTTSAVLANEHPVVISKFILNAKEIEYDGVAAGGKIINFAISEHVENAGVHSGDATLLLPAQKLYVETLKRVKQISAKIALALKITGPFNIQYLSVNNDIKVIECNLRASRSFPFVSKCFNVNFIEMATRVMVGQKVRPAVVDLFQVDHVCMKVPMFSFTRLAGADPVLRVEMASTGEVACFGNNMYECYIKGLLSTGFKFPKQNVLLSAGPLAAKVEIVDCARALISLGYKVFASTGTHKFLEEQKVQCTMLYKLQDEQKEPNIITYLKENMLDLVINIPNTHDPVEKSAGYHLRRTAVDFGVPLISNVKCATLFTQAIARLQIKANTKRLANFFDIKAWQQYMVESNMLDI